MTPKTSSEERVARQPIQKERHMSKTITITMTIPEANTVLRQLALDCSEKFNGYGRSLEHDRSKWVAQRIIRALEVIEEKPEELLKERA